MKKVLLFSGLVGLSFGAFAQTLSLTGSSYTQNFDGIGSGLPTGWRVYSGSSHTSIGALETLSTSTTYGVFTDTTCGTSNVVGGGFKNYASADVATSTTSCSAQAALTNRALGVRQVSPTNATHPNLDSGAAFILVLNNTSGLSNFNLSFKLQSLDVNSPRATTWLVDYAVGAAGPFTPVTTVGTMTTGGGVFSNNTVTANFGSALDNKSGNVYIRITTLVFSSGTGNRASTAIDDYSLTWTGIPTAVTEVDNSGSLPFEVLGNATSSTINMNCTTSEAGNYNVILSDMTGRTVYSNVSNLEAGNQSISLNNLNLAKGMYIARISNGHTTGIAKVMVN